MYKDEVLPILRSGDDVKGKDRYAQITLCGQHFVSDSVRGSHSKERFIQTRELRVPFVEMRIKLGFRGLLQVGKVIQAETQRHRRAWCAQGEWCDVAGSLRISRGDEALERSHNL